MDAYNFHRQQDADRRQSEIENAQLQLLLQKLANEKASQSVEKSNDNSSEAEPSKSNFDSGKLCGEWKKQLINALIKSGSADVNEIKIDAFISGHLSDSYDKIVVVCPQMVSVYNQILGKLANSMGFNNMQEFDRFCIQNNISRNDVSKFAKGLSVAHLAYKDFDISRNCRQSFMATVSSGINFPNQYFDGVYENWPSLKLILTASYTSAKSNR